MHFWGDALQITFANALRGTTDVKPMMWIAFFSRDNPENERMPEVKQALEALKDAEPQRIAFEDLDFNFGERWIPTGSDSKHNTDSKL